MVQSEAELGEWRRCVPVCAGGVYRGPTLGWVGMRGGVVGEFSGSS